MTGRIVCSESGHDKGYFMVVVGEENGRFLVCNGKERPLERPKSKNAKHLRFTEVTLDSSQLETNKKLRKALAVFRDSQKKGAQENG